MSVKAPVLMIVRSRTRQSVKSLTKWALARRLGGVDHFGESQYGLCDLFGRLLSGVVADAFQLNRGDLTTGDLTYGAGRE